MIKRLIVYMVLVFSLVTAGSVLLPITAQAASQANCNQSTANNNAGFLGFPTWYKYLSPNFVNGECKLTLPLDDDNNESVVLALPRILLAVFEIILRVAGLAAVGFVIFGGFQYLISQGEPERTKGAKSTILNAMIGLIITLSATVVVNLIGRNIA